MSVIHFFSILGYIKMNVMVFGNAVSIYKGDVVTVTVPIKCVKLPSCIVFLSIRFLSLTVVLIDLIMLMIILILITIVTMKTDVDVDFDDGDNDNNNCPNGSPYILSYLLCSNSCRRRGFLRIRKDEQRSVTEHSLIRKDS